MPRFGKSGSEARLGGLKDDEMDEEEEQPFRINTVNPQVSEKRQKKTSGVGRTSQI